MELFREGIVVHATKSRLNARPMAALGSSSPTAQQSFLCVLHHRVDPPGRLVAVHPIEVKDLLVRDFLVP